MADLHAVVGSDASLERLQKSIFRVRIAFDEQERGRILGLRRAAAAAHEAFDEHRETVLEHALQYLQHGEPPSLRRLCGISRLEVPMNRVLAWLMDPKETHGAGSAPVLAFARMLQFRELERDITAGGDVEVLADSSPDPTRWSREPDLLIRTERAALLVENKVFASESGRGQYADYLYILKNWAGDREARAHLLARDRRSREEGWALPITHGELAAGLRGLSQRSDLPTWTRIVVALVVADLRDEHGIERAEAIRALAREGEVRDLLPHEVSKLSSLLDSADSMIPWSVNP